MVSLRAFSGCRLPVGWRRKNYQATGLLKGIADRRLAQVVEETICQCPTNLHPSLLPWTGFDTQSLREIKSATLQANLLV